MQFDEALPRVLAPMQIEHFAVNGRRVIVAGAVLRDENFLRPVNLVREPRSPMERLGRELQPVSIGLRIILSLRKLS